MKLILIPIIFFSLTSCVARVYPSDTAFCVNACDFHNGVAWIQTDQTFSEFDGMVLCTCSDTTRISIRRSKLRPSETL